MRKGEASDRGLTLSRSQPTRRAASPRTFSSTASRSSRTPSGSQFDGSGKDHSINSPPTGPGSGSPGFINTTTSADARSSTVTARGRAALVSIPSSCSDSAITGLIVSAGLMPALVATNCSEPTCVSRWAPSCERPALCLHMNRTVLGWVIVILLSRLQHERCTGNDPLAR